MKSRSFTLFENAIKSEATKIVYNNSLHAFMKFAKIKNYDDIVKLSTNKLQVTATWMKPLHGAMPCAPPERWGMPGTSPTLRSTWHQTKRNTSPRLNCSWTGGSRRDSDWRPGESARAGRNFVGALGLAFTRRIDRQHPRASLPNRGNPC